MYKVVPRLLEKMHWTPLNQLALATNGVFSMTRHHTELAARMHAEVLILINMYCITHCETLVVGYAEFF